MNQAISPGLLAAGLKLPLGAFVLDLGGEELRDAAGAPVALRPQAFAVLRHLALNAGRLVDKDELLDAIWPGRIVTDGSLTQAVAAVREALGGDARLLKTVPRRGYMLVANATAAAPARHVEPPAAGPDWPSIAVLAFKAPNGDRDGELLARGVNADLVAELARNVDIRVVSHHSSFCFADGGTPVAEIGRRLNCRHLVDGRVERADDSVRIDVELVDSESGDVAWTARYEADSLSVLAQRDALVQRIAGTLHNSARHAGARRVLRRPPKTLDCYALTARAIALRVNYFSPPAMREAHELFERALAIDPDYAPAWAYSAELTGCHALLSANSATALQCEAERQARRALELEPEHPVPYRVLSYVHMLRREFDAQLVAARRGLELSPSNADQMFGLASAYLSNARNREALQTSQSAMDLHPLPPLWVMNIHAQALWANGRLEESLALADACLLKDPHFAFARLRRMCALVELGRLPEARAEAAQLAADAPWMNAASLQNRYADAAHATVARLVAAFEAAASVERPARGD